MSQQFGTHFNGETWEDEPAPSPVNSKQMSNETNLYDFLRRLQRDSDGQPGAITLTPEERAWLNMYLADPGLELHFKATLTGEVREGLPVFAQNFSIAGNPEDIFALLAEAAMQNPAFSSLVMSCASFMRNHVRTCPTCSRELARAEAGMKLSKFSEIPQPTREGWNTWQFCPHR